MSYLSVTEFASSVGISDRKAREALRRCYQGKTWRGTTLDVRLVGALGGPGGSRYEVSAESLCGIDDQRSPAISSQPVVYHTAPVAVDQRWKFRQQIIQPILQTERASAERAKAIRDAVNYAHLTAQGAKTFSERTIRGWVAEYEQRGLAALKRKPRADRGAPRVRVSREWDRHVIEAGIAPQQADRIARDLQHYVRSLWASPTAFAGWKQTAFFASAELRRLTAAALGSAVDVGTVRAICEVPRDFVERERAYRAVGVHDRDRKRHEDISRPRIQRSIEGMRPMQRVMGDVHPLDIYYRRNDGSMATAKLVAFLDVATHRIRFDAVFLEKGEGVRTEHVVGSFIDMVRDPRWGLPSGLYLDNGSEYQWDGFINDAMNLSGIAIHIDGSLPPKSATATSRAQAYNAAAKGVLEGAFHQLEQRFFSLLPGYVGGNRLLKKSANVGKAPDCWTGSRAELAEAIRNVQAFYNSTPQNGRLGGLSPDEQFAALVEAGWKRTDMGEHDLYAVFCAKETRTVRQGVIRFDGRAFYDDALAALSAGTPVTIGIPKWGERDRLAVWDEKGRFLCAAEPDRAFFHEDQAGAIEASRRQKIQAGSVRRMREAVSPIDGRDLIAQAASEVVISAKPERGAVVRFDPNQTQAGQALVASSTERANRKRTKDQEYRDAMGGILQKLVGNGG